MTDLRETLARAIAGAEGKNPDGTGWGPHTEPWWKYYAPDADACIAALAAYFEREEVVTQAARRLRQVEWEGRDEWEDDASDHEYWRASARAALRAAIGVEK